MDRFIIEGQNKLSGSVKISGSKNSSLPILAASILCQESSKIANIPDLVDTQFMLKLLRSFGLEYGKNANAELVINAKNISSSLAHYDMVRKMRASILVLAPLLARQGYAQVSLPGGCAIGSRPVDIHLDALSKMGATLTVQDGYIFGKLQKTRFEGANINLPLPSVGATEQVITAAVLAKGKTVISGAAKEPEILDLCEALITAGAKISGHGTSIIVIEGVDYLGGLNCTIKPDRIEAGTMIAAASATKSSITIEQVCLMDLQSTITHFEKAGCIFTHANSPSNDKLTDLNIHAPDRLLPVDIETAAFPGFPTDMQAQFMAAMTLANGISFIHERIFENRMMHVPELNRMGAHIEVNKGVAKVHGQSKLLGAPVTATDLRASACLVIAALAACGKTEILRIYHLDRGYEGLDKKLIKLGANIVRCDQN